MSGLWSALLSAALGGLIVFASYGSVDEPILVAAAVLFLQYLIAAGPGATDDEGRRIPTPRFTPVLAGSLAAVAVSVRPDWVRSTTELDGAASPIHHTGEFAGVPLGLAVGFFVAIGAQMLRRDGRRELVRSMAHVALLTGIAVLAVGWIGAARSTPQAAINAIAVGSMITALLLSQLPWPRRTGAQGEALTVVAFLIPVVAAAGVAVAIGEYYAVGLEILMLIALGGLVAVFSLTARDVAIALCAPLRHSGPKWGFIGAFPVAVVGPLAFVASQLTA